MKLSKYQETGIKKRLLEWTNKIAPGERICMVIVPGTRICFDKIDMVNAIYKIGKIKQ